MKGDIFDSFFSHYSQSQLGLEDKIWSLTLNVQGGGSTNNALNRAARSIGSESKDDIQQKVPNFLYCFNHTRVAVYGALGRDIIKEFQDDGCILH